ncbi:MBL fold metallo-hydrolase [Alkalibacter rhizosphaerae]|uniref:MBL fold metallo-hydrolase n=1 Tax=Alkalibacter rhizosphaerae TaxID=2815577 RepID=A0A975AI45_9FIRM|nr:MBL fold metallo-hydrolase [Alkalibacter rhizosphaerae]QSX08693.1 MBL fold metallo-hydrolase [Alkalibacter rhizosphaerae]
MTKDFTLKVDILGYWGAFPQPGGATSGVLITTSEGKFLIDLGSGVLAKYFEHGNLSEQFQGVLLSHLHYDHMGDIGCLCYAINHANRVGTRSSKMIVYAPNSPAIMWKAIQYPYSDTRVLEDGMELEIAGAKVTVKKVNHTIECYAFRIERNGRSVVFYTDSSYDESHIDFIKGADLLICEATVSLGTRHSTGRGHMSDIEAGMTAAAAGVGKLCLYHLPSDGDIPFMRIRAGSKYDGPIVTPDMVSEFIL